MLLTKALQDTLIRSCSHFEPSSTSQDDNSLAKLYAVLMGIEKWNIQQSGLT
jgi:hypothetical protein